MKSILFHVEQHAVILNLLLAQTTWVDRFFGEDTPLGGRIILGLFLVALLAVALFALLLVLGTLKDSWLFFRFLRTTRESFLPCTRCGYDLRHKPERCPECGQPVWFRTHRKTAAPIPPPSAAAAWDLPEEPNLPAPTTPILPPADAGSDQASVDRHRE